MFLTAQYLWSISRAESEESEDLFFPSSHSTTEANRHASREATIDNQSLTDRPHFASVVNTHVPPSNSASSAVSKHHYGATRKPWIVQITLSLSCWCFETSLDRIGRIKQQRHAIVDCLLLMLLERAQESVINITRFSSPCLGFDFLYITSLL